MTKPSVVSAYCLNPSSDQIANKVTYQSEIDGVGVELIFDCPKEPTYKVADDAETMEVTSVAQKRLLEDDESKPEGIPTSLPSDAPPVFFPAGFEPDPAVDLKGPEDISVEDTSEPASGDTSEPASDDTSKPASDDTSETVTDDTS